MPMNRLRTFLLWGLKFAGNVLYPSSLTWLNDPPKDWREVKLVLILNHTSLFEFVYSVVLPYSFLREIAEKLVIPVADKTLDRPVSGFIFRNLAPHTVRVTRKRDESWQQFLGQIGEDNICIFMPEGQMKRKNGVDRHGRPMRVKTGVYDLLQKFRGKKMIIAYSHGLHHVLAPGDRIPKIFKRVAVGIQHYDVDEYLAPFEGVADAAKQVAQDLQRRRDRYCPAT